ncbi:MAG TPA: Ni/Fe-hydrogenase cytochrome b subunit [Candidatus Acidoferrales bacterium]|nr:Ni/Fe-hydrogenase cytochrome b subunit [Candidatus Acidoferrales bacterium]
MTTRLRLPRLTVWQWIFAALMLGGLYATYVRVVYGLGGATNLSDEFPWGLWIGFDILCGVGLAAGGFTLAAIVYIFNLERYKPILRATILTAFLGYLLVIVALLFDLGRPYRIWHPLVMWNPRSVMFEVAWCVMLYTTVLALEFAPAVFERLGWKTPLGWMRTVSIPLVMAGVILSTLHQSSLGSLYLIVPMKLHPLWYSPLLPLFFFVSAIMVGFAMTIFESWHSSRAFGKQLERPLLASMGRVLAVLLAVYLLMRFLDLRHRGVLPLLLEARTETYLFALEIALLLLPMLLLFRRHVRLDPGALYACAVMVIFGFVAHRLNVSITGMETGSGTHYVPKWTEVMVTLAIIALGFAIFRLAAKHLPIFAEEKRSVAPPTLAPLPEGGR